MRVLILLVSALLSSAVAAQTNRLTSARLDGDVLRLDVSADPQAVRHFPLASPPRVVIDLFGIDRSAAELPKPPQGSSAFELRTGEHADFLRVVVDLRAALPSYQVRQSEGLIEVGLGSGTLPPSATGVLIGESPDPGSLSAPRPVAAPVVDVAVEAAPGARPAPAASPVSPAPTGSELQNLDDLTTDELLALIDAELAAAGLDQEQSAEELIEQVEAELAARPGSPTVPEEPAEPEERAPAREGDPEDRPPFRFIDEEPDDPPGS
ncbi:MAG: AMIN domain-containing protein [Acidobacteria bacterium]|nr:AMIN domain-containing protein [Acidobacteriota bacterium]